MGFRSLKENSLVARPSQSVDRIDDDRHGRSAGGGNVVPLPPAPAGKPTPVARKPARPRLVHLLSRRRADRFRPLRGGLSDHAEMDAGRDRLRAVDRRDRRPAWTDAGRRHRRCRALRTAGGGPCGRHHRLQCAGLCVVADLSRGDRGRDAACARELRAGSGDCRDQPRSGRAACDRGAAWTQRPLCIARQRLRGGADGRDGLPAVEPIGVFCHRPSRDPYLDGARADPRAGDRRGAIPWRRGAGGSRYRGHQRVPSSAPAPAVDLCRRRAAVSARECGHAAADGGRRHHAVEPNGRRC